MCRELVKVFVPSKENQGVQNGLMINTLAIVCARRSGESYTNIDRESGNVVLVEK